MAHRDRIESYPDSRRQQIVSKNLAASWLSKFVAVCVPMVLSHRVTSSKPSRPHRPFQVHSRLLRYPCSRNGNRTSNGPFSDRRSPFRNPMGLLRSILSGTSPAPFLMSNGRVAPGGNCRQSDTAAWHDTSGCQGRLGKCRGFPRRTVRVAAGRNETPTAWLSARTFGRRNGKFRFG